VIEVVARERRQAPPPHVVWESLVDPHRPAGRQWLSVADDELEPRVIEADAPSSVVWSSLWPDRPRDRIRFTVQPDGGAGSRLRWSLETDDEVPDADRVKRIRHRIDSLINGELRNSWDN
jgi:hypothetical protein